MLAIKCFEISLLSPRFFKKAKGILQSPPSVFPLCYLLLNRWTKFNQIWCVSYSHKWGMQQQLFFWPRPLGRGQKVKYHLISVTKSISKIFIPTFVCVLTYERYKTYQTGFSFCRLGHAPGVGLRGAGGGQGVKMIFFKHGHVAYQIDRDDKQNRMQVKFTGDLGVRSKGQISKIFIPNFVCVLTNERYKTYQTRFSFCCLGHALGVGLRGAGGAQGGGSKMFVFSNMVMCHVAYQSTGMTSRKECK